MIFNILILAAVINFTLSLPILDLIVERNGDKVQPTFEVKTRSTRQIVQPSWLNIGFESTADPTVYVNPQSLFEAAEIRKTIQKAVDEDTYAVTAEEQATDDAMKQSTSTLRPKQNIETENEGGLLNLYMQMQTFWNNWMQGLFKAFNN